MIPQRTFGRTGVEVTRLGLGGEGVLRTGAIEAFDRAKQKGKVRYVGVSGHEDPQILVKAFELYDFDAVLMPVNPAEPHFLSFLDIVLPEAKRRGMAVIGMKVLCRGLGVQIPEARKAQDWIRYALGHDVSTIVVGCEDPSQVQENAAAAQLEPMDKSEQGDLEKIVEPYARRLMYYK